MDEAWLGETIRAVRLGQNRSQSDVAQSAGVALNAVRALESGNGARVATLVGVLRALDCMGWLNEIHAKEAPVQKERKRSGHPRASKSAALIPGLASENGWFSREQVQACDVIWPQESESEFAI